MKMKFRAFFTLIAAAVVLQVAEAAGEFKEYHNFHIASSQFGSLQALELDEANGKGDLDICAALAMYYESVKHIIPCGYPPLKIPQLDPFCIDHADFNFFNFFGSISNFRLYGLRDILILNFDCNSTANNISFDIFGSKIQILARYDIGSTINLPILPFELGGKGLFDAIINNLRFVGHIHWENPESLRITEFKLNFYVSSFEYNNWSYFLSELLNNSINKWASDLSRVAVQEVQKYLDFVYSLFFFPQINNELKNVTMTQTVDFFLSRAMEMSAYECQH